VGERGEIRVGASSHMQHGRERESLFFLYNTTKTFSLSIIASPGIYYTCRPNPSTSSPAVQNFHFFLPSSSSTRTFFLVVVVVVVPWIPWTFFFLDVWKKHFFFFEYFYLKNLTKEGAARGDFFIAFTGLKQ
jgi:hypothetical protein